MRTVFEYHRVSLNASDNLANSAYVLTPVPSKLHCIHVHAQSHALTAYHTYMHSITFIFTYRYSLSMHASSTHAHSHMHTLTHAHIHTRTHAHTQTVSKLVHVRNVAWSPTAVTLRVDGVTACRGTHDGVQVQNRRKNGVH